MVPEGWKQSEVGDHVELLSGFPFKSSEYSDDPEDIRLLRGDNIGQGHLRWRDAKRWDKSQYDQLTKYHLSVGDFVIAMDRTWVTGGLKVAEVRNHDLPSLLLQRVSRLRTHRSLDQRLLRFFINGYLFEQYVKSVQTETAVPHISARQIKEFPILLPPLSEQRKIADILSTWDQAIDKTETLLSNARTQKRALMQQLLTGKRRFPEFAGQPWKEVRLGDMGKFRKGKGLPKTVVGPAGDYPCILYGELYTTYGEFIGQTRSHTDVDDGVISEAGDILIPASTTTSGIDLAIASYVERGGIRLGGDINIFRPKQNVIEGAFLAYFLTHARRHKMAKFAQGITIVHLKGSDLLDLSIQIPPLAEQKMIMSLVTEVESEIVAIAGDLAKLRTEKKALMQQLLTGKRRVKVGDQNAI